MSTDRRIQPPFGGDMTGFWCIEGFRVNHRSLVLMGSSNEQSDSAPRAVKRHPELRTITRAYRWEPPDMVAIFGRPNGSRTLRLFGNKVTRIVGFRYPMALFCQTYRAAVESGVRYRWPFSSRPAFGPTLQSSRRASGPVSAPRTRQ